MEKPRLVASDVDGTLLDQLERVTERTATAAANVLASGTPFVLVTGRPPRWIPSVARAAGVDGYAVCSNGAVLYDIATDRVIASRPLSPRLMRDVVHAIIAVVPEAAVAAERVGESALGMNGREFVIEVDYRHPWPGDPQETVTRDELLGIAAVKLLIREPAMTSDELAEIARAVVGDAVDITFSSNSGMIEISTPGTTKGTGLAEVADRLGVDSDGVIAFGDMPNDVPMLRWAGHGVAMANAHRDALAVADEVAASNGEDGVAQVLERWF